MSRLNETYSEMTKDVAKMLIPMMGKVDTKGFSEEAFDMTKVVMMSMGLIGDLLEAIDELEVRQKETEAIINKLGKVILAKNDLDSTRYDLLLEEIRSIKKINNRKESKKEE